MSITFKALDDVGNTYLQKGNQTSEKKKRTREHVLAEKAYTMWQKQGVNAKAVK